MSLEIYICLLYIDSSQVIGERTVVGPARLRCCAEGLQTVKQSPIYDRVKYGLQEKRIC